MKHLSRLGIATLRGPPVSVSVSVSPGLRVQNVLRQNAFTRNNWQLDFNSGCRNFLNRTYKGIVPLHSISAVQFSTGPPRSSDQEENKVTKSRIDTSKIVGLGGAAALLWGKAKWVLVAAKLTKFSSVISMAATTGAYSLFFGLPFAVGMVGQIALHEAGHALAMKKLGIPFSPAVFVPFMGASIGMKERPKNISDDIFISISGPVLGGLTAFGISVVGINTDSQLLIALADFGYMINLFNLLPIGALDGGHIAGGLNRWTLVAGMGIGGAMIYQGVINNPIFYLVMISGAFTTWSRFFGSQDHLNPYYYKMNNGQRAFWTISYFGLIALLAVAMQINNKYKKSVKQMRKESNTGEQDVESMGYKIEQFADAWGKDDPYMTNGSNQSLDDVEKEFMKSYFGDRPSNEI